MSPAWSQKVAALPMPLDIPHLCGERLLVDDYALGLLQADGAPDFGEPGAPRGGPKPDPARRYARLVATPNATAVTAAIAMQALVGRIRRASTRGVSRHSSSAPITMSTTSASLSGSEASSGP